MARDRGVRGDRNRGGDRGELVRVSSDHQDREQRQHQPRRREGRRRDEAQVQAGDHEQMSHPGQREVVAQRLIDPALVADYQRAHLLAFGRLQIGVDKRADAGADFLDRGCRPAASISDRFDFARRACAAWRLRHDHRGRNGLAGLVGLVIELARISVVARKANPGRDAHLLSDFEAGGIKRRHAHRPASWLHRRGRLTGALDADK